MFSLTDSKIWHGGFSGASVSPPFTQMVLGQGLQICYLPVMSDRPTPAQWLARAAEARRIAEGMRDPIARREMLAIAAGYGRLAGHAASAAEQSATSDKDREWVACGRCGTLSG
jgi:hypothetical protein